MLINTRRRLVVFILALTTLALLAGVITFVHSLNLLRAQVEETFRSRAALVNIFVALQRDQIAVVRNLLVDGYLDPTINERDLAGRVRAVPGYPVWTFDSGATPLIGRLTGDAALPLDASLRREALAALRLGVQMRPALELSSEVAWMYYLSASRFMYMAPDVPVEQFHFTAQLYGRNYWRKSTPEENPQRKMVLDGPYEDAAGKGLIFTFAMPVYAGERFLGLVAQDLRIDTLQQLVAVGEAPGETMLVSEDAHLITRAGGFQPGTRLSPPLGDQLLEWRADERGDHWLSTPVVADELWAVHRLKRHTLLWAAARESALTWLLILMIQVLCLFAWRLMGAFAEMSRMTHTDPLTQVLNRRGFYEKAQMVLAMAARKRLVPVLMLMDIDHFKKINDTHGHAVGDSVLQQLGGYLLKACRPFDLVCRWGGEEFVVILLLDEDSEALPAAERVREEGQRMRIQPGDLPVTLSAGLVVVQAAESLDEAVKRADLLLYRAKSNGRNRIEHEPGL